MKNVKVQLIRNATVKLDYAGQSFLIDPMLSAKESFMSFVEQGKDLNPTIDLPIKAEEVVEGINAVLLTHAHPDHLDPKAIEVLPKDISLIGQIADKEALSKMPFSNVTLVEEKVEYQGITVTPNQWSAWTRGLIRSFGNRFRIYLTSRESTYSLYYWRLSIG